MNVLFEGNALWFSIPAFLGTFFFLFRILLMLVGGDGDMDSDFDADLDADVEVDHSTSAFKLLSVQTITAFLMGFGWGGLGGLVGAGWDAMSSVVFGGVVGVGMVWLLTKLLRMVYRLQSSGTVAISQAFGLEGSVYTAIPGQQSGRGSVRVVIDDRQRYLKAVTEGEAIESRSRIVVTAVNDDNTVTVTRA